MRSGCRCFGRIRLQVVLAGMDDQGAAIGVEDEVRPAESVAIGGPVEVP
jgi:hypothetical protein